MPKVLHVVLAAVFATTLASNALAQSQNKVSHLKPFTAEERLVFDRASANTGGPAGGGAGGAE